MGATTHPTGLPYRSMSFGAGDHWFAITASIFIVLGLAAMVAPAIAGLAVAVLVGWLLILGSIVNAIEAFKGGGVAHVMWQLLVACVYFVGGAYFLAYPLIGLGTLTLALAGILLAEGIMKIIAFVQLQEEEGSLWLLLNGCVTLLLAGLIWFGWPSSSVWAIGTIVGINLLMSGILRLVYGGSVSRILA
jgi:uncharacterized membrane protein HdeD (DUF308 family)